MGKSLLYKLFGLGKLPKSSAPVIETEGVVVMDEGVKGSVTLRDFKAPGKYRLYKKTFFAGSIVVTRKRFLAFSFSRRIADIALDDERLKRLDVSAPEKDVLVFKFNVRDFHPDWRGSAEFRYKTPSALKILDKIT